MADALMVKCKGCYTPFEVPDQQDEATFAHLDVASALIRCPHCGIRRPYDKGDFFYGSGEEEPPLW